MRSISLILRSYLNSNTGVSFSIGLALFCNLLLMVFHAWFILTAYDAYNDWLAGSWQLPALDFHIFLMKPPGIMLAAFLAAWFVFLVVAALRKSYLAFVFLFAFAFVHFACGIWSFVFSVTVLKLTADYSARYKLPSPDSLSGLVQNAPNLESASFYYAVFACISVLSTVNGVRAAVWRTDCRKTTLPN